jgi:hypothetical protein
MRRDTSENDRIGRGAPGGFVQTRSIPNLSDPGPHASREVISRSTQGARFTAPLNHPSLRSYFGMVRP